jgi:hypothetical protein
MAGRPPTEPGSYSSCALQWQISATRLLDAKAGITGAADPLALPVRPRPLVPC